MATISLPSLALAIGASLAGVLSSSAQTSIPIPDFSFDTHGADFSGSSYADQTNVNWPYDGVATQIGEPFAGWLTPAANYQIYSVSTTGDTGSFDGANAVQVNGTAYFGYTIESLTPVVASIANNATYTLKFALANDGGGSGDVTLSMLTTTSAPNTHNYSTQHIGNNPANGYYPATSPYPILTTVNTIASKVITGSTINGQTVGDFTDYSVSFDTLNGDNAASVGQDLTLALNSDGGSFQFDNARLTVDVVPEPGTWALMLGGFALFCFVLRRKVARA